MRRRGGAGSGANSRPRPARTTADSGTTSSWLPLPRGRATGVVLVRVRLRQQGRRPALARGLGAEVLLQLALVRREPGAAGRQVGGALRVELPGLLVERLGQFLQLRIIALG